MLLVFTLSLALLAVGVNAAPAEMSPEDAGIYDRIFNAADVDIIVNNDRILDLYLRCFFSTGPCTTLGKEIKGKITEVMSDVCGKCTLEQKRVYHHALHVFIPKRPKDWDRMLEIYDPTGAYWPGLKAFLDAPSP